MRKLSLFICLMVILVACEDKKDSFTIAGTLKNTPAKVVYIEETNIATGEKQVKDSSAISENGKFSMEVETKEEGVYNLRMQNEAVQFATIINDGAKLNIEADFNKRYDFYNVSGSAASKSIQEYLAKINELQREKFNYLVQADSITKNNGDAALAQSLVQKEADIISQLKTYTQQTVQKANKAPLGLFILATYQEMARNPNYRMNGFTAEELIAFLDEMINKFPGRADLAGIKKSVEAQIPKSMWVGKEAPEISLPDTEGRKVSLSSFRGKYVLVDFWASWCGPCRRENPNVVDAYNKFKGKNFTILGVSLDRPGQKDSWLKAIKDDNLTWTHISDLQFWNSEVVPVYRVQSIPFNVLVDPQGKVIAENLRGDALGQTLQQVLN
jgi:peroxiredoxin